MNARGAHPQRSAAAQPANLLKENTLYVASGMPPLKFSNKTRSFFEFWPTWLMYLPVVIQSLGLAVRYRSLSLPLIANPKLTLSGMVGVAKSELLSQATGACAEAILPWFTVRRDGSEPQLQAQAIGQRLDELNFGFPVVCKPDIGCRGAGVKLVKSPAELAACLARYPCGASLMLQRLSQYEPEVGIFYVRQPNASSGNIVSMALKYSPYVVGDGQSSLRELLAQDPRAGDLQHLYTGRHARLLDRVLAAGEPFKLVFSASHCRGAIFKDAADYITPRLEARLNDLMAGLPEFYYGRLDVKFKDIDSLQMGENIEIIEINGASSESLHIWDSDAGFVAAVGALLKQYKTLFKLGHLNRLKGYRPPGLSKLLQHWRHERELTNAYPDTD